MEDNVLNYKESLPQKIKHFLEPDVPEDLENAVKEYDNYANYNIMTGTDRQSRDVLMSLYDVPAMLKDEIIKGALSTVMNTAFQTDSEDNVFKTQCGISSIENELNNFHEQINAQELILTIGYNLLLWGQLPFKHCFNSDNVLERVIPIPDFTEVTPIIISGKIIGFMYEDEFHPSYEFTYAQTRHFNNLGGIVNNNYLRIGSNQKDGTINELKNEFVYADSYLGSVVKSWKNINAIEESLLLNRMDQANYYRIISVNVGGQVYSKSGIRVLNFYRNLFKKVRRISYDAQGMASRGQGQNFEVIVPKTENQGVEIQNVGGNIDVRALKDLDTQYNRLFAGLQLQPSMIGFSSDTPSSLGNSTELTWDKRFAKLCKVYSFASFNALKNIDYIHLRSLGYNVKKTDWHYVTVNTTVQDEQERGESLKLAIENYRSLVEAFNLNNVVYDKSYLAKTLLDSSLNSFGVDTEKLLNPVENQDEEMSAEAVNASYRNDILAEDAHAMAISGVFEESKAKELVSAFVEGKLSVEKVASPLTLKELCSSVAVNNSSKIDLTGYVEYIDNSVEALEKKLSRRTITHSMQAEQFIWPVKVPKECVVTTQEIAAARPCVINKLYIDKEGCAYILSKTDLLAYLSTYINDGLDVYCKKVIQKK